MVAPLGGDPEGFRGMSAAGGRELERALEASDLTFERLYRIEIERAVPAPDACASETRDRVAARLSSTGPVEVQAEPRWERRALLYDLQERSLPQILDEIEGLLEGESGRWRITTYYWSGQMQRPGDRRLMGKGESFTYSPNARGELVLKLEPSIEIDLGGGDE